jgi:hypothetical protein
MKIKPSSLLMCVIFFALILLAAEKSVPQELIMEMGHVHFAASVVVGLLKVVVFFFGFVVFLLVGAGGLMWLMDAMDDGIVKIASRLKQSRQVKA